MLATIVAAVANLAGDLLLCVYPFKLGIAGAAWATVAAQAVRMGEAAHGGLPCALCT